MLQIKDIRKTYVTGDFVQTALAGISLNLRDNEFVAILGPSGSGKTTLLNIIGGLDRYDDGDLVINGISTKKYTDRDWDSYRNHTIGFVFQSYNLIPHQTVLSNVELALTISGISRAERRKRAEDALIKVGLEDHMNKKPNQLSGGQMQRVAIARALVNDPDILLADEPTGALDTVTSIQVMDLLKEVAEERLVVMVTHNPELAEEYATRIVNLRDGMITGDSDPYVVADEIPAVHKNMGKASMSFLTSLLLSFNNLKTKKGRTFLTAFAGSIGIIGIALILSLSNGVNEYIRSVEEDTLSEYPLEIDEAGVNLTSLILNRTKKDEGEYEVRERHTLSTMFSNIRKNDLFALKLYLESRDSHIYDYANAVEYTFTVTPRLYRMTGESSYRQVSPNPAFSRMGMNSSAASSAAMSRMNIFSSLPEDANLYKEKYDILVGRWPENYNECVVVLSNDQIVSDLTLYTLGLKDPKEFDKMMEAYSKGETMEFDEEEKTFLFNDFLGIQFRIVDNADCYEYDSEYDVYVDKSDNKDYMLKKIRNGEPLEVIGVVKPHSDEDAMLLGTGICYHHSLDLYVMEHAQNSEIVKKQLAHPDINVFTGKDFADEEASAFNMESLFTIDTEAMANAFQVDASGLNIDPSAFSNIKIDPSAISFDMSDFNVDMGEAGQELLSNMMKNITVEISSEEMLKLFETVLNSYLDKAAEDPSTDYRRLGEAVQKYMLSDQARNILREDTAALINELGIVVPTEQDLTAMVADIMSGYPAYAAEHMSDDTDQAALMAEYLSTQEVRGKIASYAQGYADANQDIAVTEEQITKILNDIYQGYETYAEENKLPDPSVMASSFMKYLDTNEGRKLLNDGLKKAVNIDEIEKELRKAFSETMSDYSGKMQSQIEKMMKQVMGQIGNGVSGAMKNMMTQFMNNMQNIFHVDVDAFRNAIQINMDADSLQELMMSMMTSETATYEGNLTKLNYADEDIPAAIYIYPKDFESKGQIINILDSYNERMEAAGEDDKVITYTDYVGALMSSVTNIIDTISYVLVAFVAISLIVSSIMIGIITYISVLERTKEIGILRAIGASKRNISQVFNAETFIIGLLSGVLGILIAALLLIPGNALIHAISGNTEVNAILPVAGALILIVISVLLTLIGGIIPSRKAAKKDPVTALRTE